VTWEVIPFLQGWMKTMQPLEVNQGAVRDDLGGRAESQTVIMVLSHR